MQRFVLNKQFEPDHDQVDFNEPVHAHGLVVHRNQPSQRMNKTKIFSKNSVRARYVESAFYFKNKAIT